MLWHAMGQDRSRVAVDKALLKRGRVAPEAHAQDAESGQPSGRFGAWVAAAANLGRRRKEGRYGGFLLAPEDLALLDLCGFRTAGQAKALFLFVRVVLFPGLPVAAVFWVPPPPSP